MNEPANDETDSDGANSTVVVFGAHETTLGGVAPFFAEGGLEVVFIERSDRLCRLLRNRGSYDIAVVGPEPDAIQSIQTVAPVRVVDDQDRVRVAGEIALAELVCLSDPNLIEESVAQTLAAGLLARRKSLATPLNVLLCNAEPYAVERWRELVSEHLPEKNRADVLARTGFARAIICRFLMTIPGRWAVSVTAYLEFVVDAYGLIASLPFLPGVEVVANFEAHQTRDSMMYRVIGVALGCLGYAAGHEHSAQAMDDSRIAALIRAVVDETSQALIAEYGFEPDAQTAYAARLLAHFADRGWSMDCRFLAHWQMAALAPKAGLVGAARLCERHGIAPVALVWAIVAVLRRDDPSDDESVELQTRLRENGLEATLWQVCEIAPGEALGRRIEEVWQATNNGAS